MAIVVNKPDSGGSLSVTTGAKVGGTGLQGTSQSSAIASVLSRLIQVDLVTAANSFSRPDTATMTGVTLYRVQCRDERAADSVGAVLGCLDNANSMSSAVGSALSAG